MIVATKVSLLYGSGQAGCWAVKEVTLRVEHGEFVMVLGPSGSGKSSLLYLLSGLRAPTNGDVLYLGRAYSHMGASEMARMRYRHFGFVFQQHFLVPYLTAMENVCMGRDKLLTKRAGLLLEQLQLEGKGTQFPSQLSHGERQRVAVARAIVHEPQVIFADEPTASVDSELASQICVWLQEYCRSGHTCIMATHDSKLTDYADTVYLMRDGRIC